MKNLTRHANEILATVSGTIAAAMLGLFLILPPTASAQTFRILYQFKSGSGGINPEAGVVLDASGDLYGTTFNDGAFASGTVYRLSPAGKHNVLHSFTGTGGDGAFPFFGSLVRDSAGNLYGTTQSGGIYSESCLYGCGTVFKVDASGKESVLYSFTGAAADGDEPWFGVVRDSAGNLYGTTLFGGTYGLGMVFKLDPASKETALYDFTGSTDGGLPSGALVLDSAGNVYGTTEIGGSSFFGGVYKVTPDGAETALYSFTGGTDGVGPGSGLVRDSAGNLYGTTSGGGASGLGTVFKVSPSGKETILYSFIGGTDGLNPYDGSLVRDSAGIFTAPLRRAAHPISGLSSRSTPPERRPCFTVFPELTARFLMEPSPSTRQGTSTALLMRAAHTVAG